MGNLAKNSNQKQTFFDIEPSYKIFIINLDRSPERFAQISTQLNEIGLEFERVSAVDGNALSIEFINQYYSEELNRKKYYAPLRRGEIGCYLSHLKVCQKIVEENLDYAIILEDDVSISPSFKIIPDVIKSIKEDWNYIKLISPFRKKKIIKAIEVLDSLQNSPYKFELIKWNKPPTGTQAYVINLEGAKEFIKKRTFFYRPIDVDLQFTWETNLDVMGLTPHLCEITDAETSIQGRKSVKYHYPLARLIYKLKYLFNKHIMARRECE